MARTRSTGHDPDLRPHGTPEREESDGGDEPMSSYRFTRPPRRLTRCGVKLDNVALVPASLLRFKAEWQQVANRLPKGSFLICVPQHQRLLGQRIVSHLRAKGKHVAVL